jgi:hypothetical protein
MKYAIEMGSGAMIYIYIYIHICTKFNKDWLSHSNVTRGIHRETEVG